jgi:hypothetical protein
VALVDALGNRVRFVLLPGNRHDSVGVMPLIADIDFDALIADKPSITTPSAPSWTSGARMALLSPHRLVESRRSPTTQRCTSGGI